MTIRQRLDDAVVTPCHKQKRFDVVLPHCRLVRPRLHLHVAHVGRIHRHESPRILVLVNHLRHEVDPFLDCLTVLVAHHQIAVTPPAERTCVELVAGEHAVHDGESVEGGSCSHRLRLRSDHHRRLVPAGNAALVMR